MGTTMVVLIMAKNKFVCANIGDSRIYLVKNEGSKLLTKDHTYLQQYMDSRGQLPDEECIGRYSSYLFVAIDGTDNEPDIYPTDKEWEDFSDNACLLLCSDGLIPGKKESLVVTYTDVTKSFNRPKKACEQLISTTYFNGSTDNISVILIEGPDYQHELKWQKELPFPPENSQRSENTFSNSGYQSTKIKRSGLDKKFILLFSVGFDSFCGKLI